jgi:hypothetical protein
VAWRIYRYKYDIMQGCVILYIFNFAGQEAQASHPDKYSKLFRKLSLPLLKLGCDPDPAIHRLYNLLLLQLVHWYSSKFKLKSKDVEILIQTLMVCVTVAHVLTFL